MAERTASWEAWCHRLLAEEDVVRLILDGTVVRARLDRRATSISLLVVLGIRRDGQKVLLAVRDIGGESEAAWRSFARRDLVSRGLPARATFVIIDGAAGLEKALGLVWSDALVTALHRAQAPQPVRRALPERLHEEIFGRLQRHDLRWHAEGDRDAPQVVHPQMAAEMSCRCRQPPGAGDRLFSFYPSA